MASNDIKLDGNLDLQISNGDFVVADAEQQSIELILRAAKGHFKNAPILGVGAKQYLNSPQSLPEQNNILKQTKLELERDNWAINVLNYSQGQLDVNAEKKGEDSNQYANLSAVPKGLYDHFYIEISDDEGNVDPNKYRRIYLNLGTYYSIDQQYAYPDQDGYEPLSIEQGLIKVKVDDELTDYVPGLVRGDLLFIDENEQPHELTALPICFVVPN